MVARGSNIGSSSDDELAFAAPTLGPRTRRHASAALATLAACAALAACSTLAMPRQAGAAVGLRGAPVTVRALLEGPELTEVATDNVVAVGRGILGPVNRDAARAEVAAGFKELSETIQEHDPEAHERLGTLELSQKQKDSVLRVLGHYSDPRMLALSNDIAGAVRATADEQGDKETLKRHLAEILGARQEELRQLHEEMLPEHSATFDALNLDNFHVVRDFDAWHATFKVQMADPTEPAVAAAARRLAASSVATGVAPQARTLFDQLEGIFGEEMPKAPARMLQTTRGANGGDSDESLMSCMMQAMQSMSVSQCFTCIMQNLSSAMRMFTRMIPH